MSSGRIGLGVIVFIMVLSLWLFLRPSSSNGSIGDLPSSSSLVTIVLCCQHKECQIPGRDELHGLNVIWKHDGVDDASLDLCVKSRPRNVVVRGSRLSGVVEAVPISSEDVRVVGEEGEMALVVRRALMEGGERRMVQMRTAGQKRGLSLEEDVERVKRLKEWHGEGEKELKEEEEKKKKKDQMQQRKDQWEGWGYHPWRMEPRWRAIRSSVLRDGPNEASVKACVDWGSNEGYFSVRMAQTFGGARVLGVEGEAVDEYVSARERHMKRAKQMGVTNTEVCNADVQGSEFERAARKWAWDVQLSLSVFHWFTISDHDDFLRKLGWHLAGAKTTFLELPEARVYGDNTGQTRAKQLNRWYGGMVNETQIVMKACEKVKHQCRVRNLGMMFHQTGTLRTILRVDSNAKGQAVDVDAFRMFLNCK